MTKKNPETLLLSKHMKNPIQSGKKYRMIYQKNIIKKKGKKPNKQPSNSGLISQTRNLLSYRLKLK